MIKRLEIAGVHMEVDEDLKKYVQRKIGQLDRYVSSRTRESLHVEVKLKNGQGRGADTRACEVIMHAPQETFTATETAANSFAAVDLVEEKLKNHLKKYKELHTNPRLHQRVLSRLKRRQFDTE